MRGESPAQCEYRAVAILDAWTSLYASGIDADVDTLTGWMRAVSLCAPRTRGGQALLIGGNRSRARTIVDAVEFADACPSRSGGPRPDRAAAGISPRPACGADEMRLGRC